MNAVSGKGRLAAAAGCVAVAVALIMAGLFSQASAAEYGRHMGRAFCPGGHCIAQTISTHADSMRAVVQDFLRSAQVAAACTYDSTCPNGDACPNYGQHHQDGGYGDCTYDDACPYGTSCPNYGQHHSQGGNGYGNGYGSGNGGDSGSSQGYGYGSGGHHAQGHGRHC